MKILFLESYFKPEKTAGARLSEELRQALVAAGHTIQIYAPMPSRGVSDETRREYMKSKKTQSEYDGAIQIRRFRLYKEGTATVARALRYVILEIKMLYFALCTKGVDLNFVGSTPPINGIIATIIKKIKKLPYVYNLQDLFPESLVSSGISKEGSILWKIGTIVSNITYKNASHIMVISDSMKKTLTQKGIPAEKISVIHNWIDTDAVRHIERDENTLFDEFSLSRDKFYVTYAGNMGKSQNVELPVQCAERLKSIENIEFVIFGDGPDKAKAEESIAEKGLENIHIYPMQDNSRISEVYSLGDVSFVACRKGVGKSAFPSKAACIMAAQSAVIASLDEDSDLCNMLRKNKIGECVPPEDAEKAAKAIVKLYNDRALCAEYSANGRAFACERLSRAVGTTKKIEILEKYSKKN